MKYFLRILTVSSIATFLSRSLSTKRSFVTFVITGFGFLLDVDNLLVVFVHFLNRFKA